MLLQRSVYRSYALTLLEKVRKPTLETLQIKDFIKDEKLLIGRVDEFNNPIFPLSRNIVPLQGSPIGPQSLLALDFVVAAFTAMKSKFDRDFSAGHISPNSPVLSELSAKFGYANPLTQYDNYANSLQGDFLLFVKKRGRLKRIRDFDSFLPVFLEYVKLRCKTAPITRSMYLMTRYLHPRSSGLVIEVWEGDYGFDRTKVDFFYRQRSFEYFKNLAYSYGFVIDKNVPWRLVADINSPQMKPFIEPLYGPGATATTVLSLAFGKTYPDDIPSLVEMLVNFYNTVVDFRSRTVTKEPSATSTEHSSKTSFNRCRRLDIINRERSSTLEVLAAYDNSMWLDIYARIRNVETSMFYSEGILQNVVDNAIDLNNSVDEPTALGYIISKFDNVEHFEGSLFYDITRIKLSKESGVTEADVAETVRRSVQASNFVIY